MKIQRNSLKLNQGFTLVEILLVVTIIGILAGLVVPNLIDRGKEARIKAAYADVNTGIKAALGLYGIDTGSYPKSLQDLVQQPAEVSGWHGPYFDPAILRQDPWGHPYQYVFPGRKNPSGYDLYSKGPDGQDGTADDIGNWQISVNQ